MSQHFLRPIGRRDFNLGLLTSAALATPLSTLAKDTKLPTVQALVDRIKARCAAEGVTWRNETVDTFKVGDPQTPVRGIVTTFMGTSALIEKAAAAGANFIISHEPIFWNHFDKTDEFLNDPVLLMKTQLIAKHGVVIWRFHDHWHALKPEPMSTASTVVLGWQSYVVPGVDGFSRQFVRPPIKLRALAEEVKQKLPSHSVRVIGNPELQVRRIATVGHSLDGVVRGLESADVVIAPEVREWDSGEYARDLVALDAPKALIMIAHERGEEAGMDRCADWLRKFIFEVPVRFMPSGEPFRAPAA